MIQRLRQSDHLLWAVGPASPLVEIKFIGTFGAADAVITVAPAGFTVGRTFLTQVGGRVSIGTGRTLHHTRTVLVQEIPCGTQTSQRCTLKSGTLLICHSG